MGPLHEKQPKKPIAPRVITEISKKVKETINRHRRGILSLLFIASLSTLLQSSGAPYKLERPKPALTKVLDSVGARESIGARNNVAVVDFFPVTLEDEEASFHRILGSTNIDQEAKKVLYLFLNEYMSHGKTVLDVFQHRMGPYFPENVQAYSLNEAIQITYAEKDEIGNYKIKIKISAEKLKQVISQIDAPIVNLSLQVGTIKGKIDIYRIERPKNPYTIIGVGIDGHITHNFFDPSGNPIQEYEYHIGSAKYNPYKILLEDEAYLSYQDGYAGSETYNNLKQMAKVAATFPDKFFVVAGGNPSYYEGLGIPDIREAREQLENEGLWPDNILVVGVWGSDIATGYEDFSYTGELQKGMDLWVSSKLIAQPASSFAAATIAEAIAAHSSKGEKIDRDTALKLLQPYIVIADDGTRIFTGGSSTHKNNKPKSIKPIEN
ncbi:hypothetical protein IPJ91_00180 [bacterium]|nr:MAG: hypothetical protein IPJ91_00180 [bacterium]